jgi:cytochrome c peroxidase
MQGIADGGLGYGEDRELWQNYDEDEIDAQGLRPLTILNVGYMENTLWSGIFGADGVNEGTDPLWGNDPLSEVNHLGLEALESENIEGLALYRLEITDKVLDEYGYREYFDLCFPAFPVEERYSVKTASFALGAYLRNVLASEAPLQKISKR